MGIDSTKMFDMNSRMSGMTGIQNIERMINQRQKLQNRVDQSKGHDQKAVKQLRKLEKKIANFKAWENSSASLFANPEPSGDRINGKGKRTKPVQKLKLNSTDSIRDKTERLRRLRLGLDVAEQSVPQEIPHEEEIKQEQIVEQHVDPTLDDHLQRIRLLKESSNRIKGKQAKIQEGFIYVLVNPAWSDWVKIGQTTDYEGRLQTYQTASPISDYKMVEIRYVSDSYSVEQEILNKARPQYEVRGEWIKCSVEQIAGML